MANNPYANKLTYFGTVKLDLSSDTVTPGTLLEGYTAHDASGAPITGTYIPSAGSAQKIFCGTATPSSSLGNNGDIYFKLSSNGSVEAYPAEYTSSDMNSTSNLGNCIGKSASDGSSTSNAYSSGNNTTGVVEYSFDLSDVPAGATISSVSCQVKAHEENASRSSFTLQLYSGSTAKGSATTVNGTSNTIYTLTTGDWTREEIDNLLLHCEFGYYGGLVAGATIVVTYEFPDPTGGATLLISENSWSISGNDMYQKANDSWSVVSTITLDDDISKQ